MIRFYVCLFLSVCFLLNGCDSTNDQSDSVQTSLENTVSQDDPKAAINDAVQYLLQKQSDDGLWRSEYYGNLKQGAGISSLVLYALAHAKPYLKEWPEESFDKGLKALQPNIEKNGYVSNDDGADYSNYGSAMYLIAALKSGHEIPDNIESKLVEYLVGSQLGQEDGFDSGNPDYGGWDLSGWMIGKRPTTGTNISVSSSVIEALAAYFPVPNSIENDHPGLLKGVVRGDLEFDSVTGSIETAAEWVGKCQNRDEQGDGGFFFHPKVNHDGNKAGWPTNHRRRARSYGSATADGYRSLLTLEKLIAAADMNTGQENDRFDLHKNAARANDWLEEHDQLKTVPGFEEEASEQGWKQGLKFYYLYSRAKTFALMDDDLDKDLPKRIVEELLELQKEGGYWQNPVSRMREDDPIIATCFALIALSESMPHLD